MKKFAKPARIFLTVILVLSSLWYPLFMVMMSAAGWLYNYREGNYPVLFRGLGICLAAGGALILLGVILVLLGKKGARWRLNLGAAGADVLGTALVTGTLSRFCDYADQNFSGIEESMQPVSELYRDRILPVLLPAVLLAVLAVWNLLDEEAREFRLRKRAERKAQENAEAPKILGD